MRSGERGAENLEVPQYPFDKMLLKLQRILKFLRFIACASDRNHHFDRWD